MRQLFDRVGHIVDLLEFDRQPPAAEHLVTAGSQLGQRLPRFYPAPAYTHTHASSLSPPDADLESIHTLPPGPNPRHVPRASTPAGISFESTMKWPIFRDLTPDRISSLVLQTNLDMNETYRENRVHDRIFGDNPSITRAASAEQASMFVLGDETYIPILCQRYLKVVHVKNPIFEVSKFNMHVKRVVEHGFDWDDSSCVVVSIFQYIFPRSKMTA